MLILSCLSLNILLFSPNDVTKENRNLEWWPNTTAHICRPSQAEVSQQELLELLLLLPKLCIRVGAVLSYICLKTKYIYAIYTWIYIGMQLYIQELFFGNIIHFVIKTPFHLQSNLMDPIISHISPNNCFQDTGIVSKSAPAVAAASTGGALAETWASEWCFGYSFPLTCLQNLQNKKVTSGTLKKIRYTWSIAIIHTVQVLFHFLHHEHRKHL